MSLKTTQTPAKSAGGDQVGTGPPKGKTAAPTEPTAKAVKGNIILIIMAGLVTPC